MSDEIVDIIASSIFSIFKNFNLNLITVHTTYTGHLKSVDHHNISVETYSNSPIAIQSAINNQNVQLFTQDHNFLILFDFIKSSNLSLEQSNLFKIATMFINSNKKFQKKIKSIKKILKTRVLHLNQFLSKNILNSMTC